MEYPRDTTGDVFRRLEEHKFNFDVPHDVEFFAVFPTEAAADAVAKQYVADHKAGNVFTNIETKPRDKGGMQLIVAKRMKLTYESVEKCEKQLDERASAQGGRSDGWEVMQS